MGNTPAMSTSWPAAGLTDRGVLVRTFRADDVRDLLAHLREPTARRWAPMFDWPDEAEAARRVQGAIEAAERDEPTSFVIAGLGDPGLLLGTIDFRNDFPHPAFSVRDLGYAVVPQARGRGVGSTALRLLAEWLLDPAGGDVHRVQLDHAVENLPSCRTASRAGFGIEGRRGGFLPLRADRDAPTVRHDVCLHGLVRG
jgi:RimJ/RimL family protein N-acetyltransferase